MELFDFNLNTNPMVNDLATLSPVEALRREINQLRINRDEVIKESEEHDEVRREINRAEAKLKEEFEQRLLTVRAEKMKAIEDAEVCRREANQVAISIREKEAALAKLIEAQNDIDRMAQLERELSDIISSFEAWSKAHPYQVEDIIMTVLAYKEGKGGFLNANDMSLGKTFETIVALYIIKHLFIKEHGRTPRILWLTKKGLVNSSPREIRRWNPTVAPIPVLGIKVEERELKIEVAMMMGDSIVVTNYEAVKTTPLIYNTTWDLVVIDEVHKLKGGAQKKPTAIWVAAKDVCRKARFVFMLSGTPMQNKVTEMWAYLHIFSPERFPDFRTFEKQYCSYSTAMGSMGLSVNVDKLLKDALKGQMIRRTKAEVGLQLPSLEVIDVILERNFDQDKLYQEMRERFFVWLDDDHSKALSSTAVIAQLTRLRQINVLPTFKITDEITKGVTKYELADSSKIDEVMDRLEELGEEPVVVFSNFNEPLFEIGRRCKEAGITVAVVAGDSGVDAGEAELAFQQGKLRVYCLNMAMGEGLNLHKDPDKWPGGASYGFILDKWWTPGRNEQCISRIHRQGCKEPVTVYNLINEDSVDSFIEAINAEKEEAFAGIMDSSMIRPSGEWKSFLTGKI